MTAKLFDLNDILVGIDAEAHEAMEHGDRQAVAATAAIVVGDREDDGVLTG